ncbi:SGNH/GDSL hydrolase family protein, partial [Paucilactobacillus hokkaidonensis]|uniref:SGNH/GDSL hydrolase family protein n=1 Tax=Paucilactobacillus hokkaidonensis TaxID=1193095 RepID=UPI0034E196C6
KKGGYVSIIKQKVEKQDNTKVITSNFGVAGDRSDQILKRLNDQSNVQQKLKSADVIVMTVGGNDLMQTLEKKFICQFSN